MWRTPEGNRVLLGAEAELFRAGLAGLVSDLGAPSDVRVFDSLSRPDSRPEKLAVLHQVGRALLLKSVPCPKHTAVGEGAITAVYDRVRAEVDAEIGEGRQRVRRLVRAACVEVAMADGVPRPGSRKFQAWSDAVEGLTERTLWDCDWEGGLVSPGFSDRQRLY